MNRLIASLRSYFWITLLLLLCGAESSAAEISITMDDPNVVETPLLAPKERDSRIREVLRKEQIKAALFVCGMRIDHTDGRGLLSRWDKEGHLIANHSYSHENFGSSNISFEFFSQDIIRGEKLISGLSHFQRFFRFPFLKEGETQIKRDQLRLFLKETGYRAGAVTIDASDWYVDERMISRLKKNPGADLKPYRDFYLKHIWDRAQYYDRLAHEVTGRQIKHTLLIHHSLLNALFLGDLIEMFRHKGWKWVDAAQAFHDPVFLKSPAIIPAGESLIWALAKESGKYEGKLRYPGEDGDYEKEEMDRLGL